jgi:plastocyanin
VSSGNAEAERASNLAQLIGRRLPKDSRGPSRGQSSPRCENERLQKAIFKENSMQRPALLLVVFLIFLGVALGSSTAAAQNANQNKNKGNVTVSFGQWIADPAAPLDRLAGNPTGGVGNNHELLPNLVRIRAGGAVNFVISGFHNVQVYDDGTQPDDVSTASPIPGVGGGIVNDANNRVYRGPDPTPIPNNFQRDRVETVHFPEPGIYLIICGIVNHLLNDNMFGFVRVAP